MNLPTQLMAGSSLELSRYWAGYTDALGFAFLFTITGAAGRIDATTVPNGDAWDVTVTASQTVNLTPGSYSIVEAATRGAETRVDLLVSPLLVTANALDQAGTPTDQRKFAEAMVANIEAVQRARAESAEEIDLTGATGASTSMSRSSPKELIDLREYWLGEVAKARRLERIAAGRGSGRMIGVRFRG